MGRKKPRASKKYIAGYRCSSWNSYRSMNTRNRDPSSSCWNIGNRDCNNYNEWTSRNTHSSYGGFGLCGSEKLGRDQSSIPMICRLDQSTMATIPRRIENRIVRSTRMNKIIFTNKFHNHKDHGPGILRSSLLTLRIRTR